MQYNNMRRMENNKENKVRGRSPLKTVGTQMSRLLTALYDRSKTTFTLRDAQATLGLSHASTRSLLRKAVVRGVVSRLKSGLFTIVPAELGSEREYAGNPYLAARELIGGSKYYLSYSTAMELHRMVTQPRLVIFASTSKRIPNRVIHSTEYKFVFTKEAEIFGTEPYWVTPQERVIISDIERTVIDGLRRPEYCGGVAEVAKGLWMRHVDMKPEKLADYAISLKVGAVIRRLGYLLEIYDLAPGQTIDRLRSWLTQTYDILDPSLPKEGPHIRRWRLQLNVSAEELKAIRQT